MLVFLDIDGVMIAAKGWKAPEMLDDGFPAFSSKATDALRNIINGDTIVMLTTSHKANYTVSQWKSLFLKRGILINNIKSLPGVAGNVSRKDEIVRWFNANSVNDDFVIIDDDKSLNGLPAFLKDKLVQTSPYIGLTEEDVPLARKILNLGMQV